MSSAQVCDPTSIGLSGLCLIEASAGTGKTFTITALALRMIVEQGIPVDGLLVVTFTKAATAELKHRIYERLQQALVLLDHGEAADPLLDDLGKRWAQDPGLESARRRIATAIADFDRASVFTIHGWCQRLLQDHCFARGDVSALELRADHSEWLTGFAQDYWSRRLYGLAPRIVAAIYQNPQRCAPAALLGVAGLALADPDLKVCGAPDWERALANYEGAHEAWLELKGRIAQSWGADPEAVRAYFQSIWPKLNQSTHRAATYQKKIDSIFAWLEQDDAVVLSETLRSALDGLSDQGLRRKKSLKAKQTLDAHLACVALDPCSQALEDLDLARDELALAFVRDFVHSLRAQVDERSASLRDCTFDELLLRVRELLRDPVVGPDVVKQTRATYAAALIDEFQDTDPAQYEIVSSFWGDHYGALFLVGDPKQAIYRFRGADIHAYLRARTDADARRYVLTHNYRSHQGVIQAVNALFSGVTAPFGIKSLEFSAVEVGRDVDWVVQQGEAMSALGFWRGEATKGAAHPWEIQALAQRVLTLLNQGQWAQSKKPVSAKDMAVLCNSNLQARKIRARFEELKIPCVLRSGQNVWHSPQGQEMAILVRAIAYPGQGSRLKAALVTQALGLSLNEVDALRSDDAGWEQWVARFFAWRKVWNERGVLAMWRKLRDQVGLGPRLAKQRGGLRALTNWDHLGDLLYFLEREHRCGPARLCALVDKARSNQEAPAQNEEIRACDERPSVQILTIHKSKGLEFPIVFCPYLWKAKANHQPKAFVHHQDQARVLMLSGPGAQDALESYAQDDHGESRRLLYVALTRAKSHCEVFWVVEKTNKSALGTLLAQHDPQGVDPLLGMQALAAAQPSSIQSGELDLDAHPEVVEHAPPAVDLPGPGPMAPHHWHRHFGPKVSSYTALAHRLRGYTPDPEGPMRPGQDESAGEPSFALDTQELHFSMLEPGAKSGILLHELFQAALEPLLAPTLRSQVLRDTAAKHGVEDPELVSQVMDILSMPLAMGASLVRLGELGPSQRGVEVEFLFRCGAFGGARPIGGVAKPIAFELRELAQLLMERAKDPRLVAYGESLQARSQARVQGFLNGFIDLVFEQDGRYFVVDYKSNILDGRKEDFTPQALWAYAAAKDYILQTLIYGVAMYRRLAQHEGQIDPHKGLGHGYLLFLRGLSAQGHGILDVPFEADIMQQLSEMMQRGFEVGRSALGGTA